MPPTAPLLPLLGVLVALMAGIGGLGAAESGQQDERAAQALTQAAKDAGHRRLDSAGGLRRAAPAAPTRAAITRAAATPISIGSVTVASPASATQVPQFAKLELLVPLTTGVPATSFYNPDPANGGLTLVGTFTGPSASWTIPGFYDGTNWRIRFAADTVGTWSYVVSAQDASGSSSSAQGAFTVVANPGNHGWVRISGGHLAYSADGTPFVGIGHNNGWLDAVETPAISAMPGIGENVLSFWLADPFGSINRNPIEASTPTGNGIGIYDQTSCATIDSLFADAEQAGVKLLPSIWAHDQLWDGVTPPATGGATGSWSGNAYSQIIDPATSKAILPIDFFRIVDSSNANTPQWTYQTNFYRYLIARWGYSTSLLGWVGVVEIDQTTGYLTTPDGASLGDAWCQSVQGYFALNDPFRGAGAALGTVPVAFSKTDQDGAGALAFDPSNPSFAMRIVDSYKSQSDPVGIATTIASETQILATNGTTPCFHSEFAALVTTPDTIEPLHFHNAVWAGIAAGAALTPLKYCDGSTSFPMINNATIGYEAHITQLAAFLHTVPYAGSATVASAQLAVSGVAQGAGGTTQAVNAWGQALSDRAFAWLQATSTNQGTHVVSSGTLGSGALAVAGLNNGAYQATWYDPWATSLTPVALATPSASGGTMSIAIPASPSGHADLALSLRQLPTATAQTVSVVAGTAIAITLAGTAGGDTLGAAAITTLPAMGALNQTNDGTSLGAAIATVPTAVTTAAPAAPMVIYTAGTTTGSDGFQFTVTDAADGLVSLPATVTVTIVPVNQPPTFTAGANISLNEDVLSATYPAWATNVLNGPGDLSTLTGFTVTTDQPALFSTPPAIAISGTTGTLSFNLKPNVYSSGTPVTPIHATATLMDSGLTAGGGGNSCSHAFTITINQIPLKPALAPQSLTSWPTYPLVVALNGSVPDGAPLAYAIASPPTNGTVRLVSGPPAQAIYTAKAGTTGADAFSVVVTDTVAAGANQGQSLATTTTFSLSVVPNLPPTATAQDLAVPENQALGIVLLGNDPDHAPDPVLTFAITTPPAHGTLSGTPPSLTYTPQTDYVGADSFAFTAFDGLATSAPATVGITVMASGSGTSGTGGGRCGSGNGFAALALLALTLGSGWRWRRVRAGC
jgi:hypothetical protein